jgi:hypothetical protein
MAMSFHQSQGRNLFLQTASIKGINILVNVRLFVTALAVSYLLSFINPLPLI